MAAPLPSSDAWDMLVQSVSGVYGVTPADMLGSSRKQMYAMPRQMLCYLARERLGWTLQDIGARVGRDHTTVHTAWNRTKRRVLMDPDERQRLTWISAELSVPMTSVERAIANIEMSATSLQLAISAAMTLLGEQERRARALRESITHPLVQRVDRGAA